MKSKKNRKKEQGRIKLRGQNLLYTNTKDELERTRISLHFTLSDLQDRLCIPVSAPQPMTGFWTVTQLFLCTPNRCIWTVHTAFAMHSVKMQLISLHRIFYASVNMHRGQCNDFLVCSPFCCMPVLPLSLLSSLIPFLFMRRSIDYWPFLT